MAGERGAEENTLTHRIGYRLLGPVMHRWLLGLHQHVCYLDDGRTTFLYCARAGVRIRRLYRIFLSGLAGTPEDGGEMFWISRLSVAKGTMARNHAPGARMIEREYFDRPIRKVVAGLLRHHPERLGSLDLERAEHEAPGHSFQRWLDGPTPEAKAIRAYLAECGDAFESYLSSLMEKGRRAVLIDSGWQGSAQSMLAAAFPEYDWHGLYVGRILTPEHDPSIADKVIGILFESDTYQPEVPESAFVAHRHIVETLLEPNGDSVEEVPWGAFAGAAEELIRSNQEEKPDLDRDRLYLLAEAYLREHAGIGVAEIIARHQAAMTELARIIVSPTREEALALACKDRSADFGKRQNVPVLLPRDHPRFQDADSRIQRALWAQGQIALEYQGGLGRELQRRATGLADGASYFDAAGESLPGEASGNEAALPQKPLIAIVTRTKNRPLLLKRAAESLARQTYDSYLWIVVNDGGDEKAVREVIEASLVDRRRIRLISNTRSLGMEAASNAGIGSCESDYLLIHDDDDSLDPAFLEKTVGFLESRAGRRYGGVITKSVYVSEEIRGNTVVEHGRSPYQDWVRNVQLAEMACGNFFPPIAFVYRRSMWEKVGGYNESLPVLGDWFFNLEFLLEADIGVIHEPLAFYHHRDRGDSSRSGVYANSVIGGHSMHEEFASITRNAFLRKHAAGNPAAMSVILGYMTTEIRSQGGPLRNAVGERALTAPRSTSLKTRDPLSPEAYGTVLDATDRVWLIACVNAAVATGRAGLLRRKSALALKLSANWDEILAALEQLKMRIPVPENFDEDLYIATNDDVAQACRAGRLDSGYEHYIRYGRAESRPRCSRFQ